MTLTVVHVAVREAPVDALELLELSSAQGWDAHLVRNGGSPDTLGSIDALPDELLLRAVHPPLQTPGSGRRRETGRLAVRFLGGLRRHPAAAGAILGRGAPGHPRLAGLYCGAVTVALRPQIIHFHSAAAASEGAALGRRLGAKVIISLSDAYLATMIEGPGRGDGGLERADALVLPAGPIGRRVLERGLLPKERCVLLSLPEPDAEPPGGESGDGLRILSIGDLSWRQGYEHGIHAVRLLLDRGVDCRYRLIGAGSHAGALRFARRQLRLEGRVDLLGSADVSRIDRELAWADVFLDPAVADSPCGLTAFAAELGMPVVASRGAPTGEPHDGIVRVRRRDPSALADRLADVATAPGLHGRRAERAAWLEETLPSEELAERLEALYLSVLDGLPPVEP